MLFKIKIIILLLNSSVLRGAYILALYESAYDERKYNGIVNLFDIYSQSYEDFIEDSDNNGKITEILVEYLSETIEQRIVDNVSDYDFTPKTEYVQVDYDDYYEELIGYELNDDIDDIISDELSYFEELEFFSKGVNITTSDLYIDSSGLTERIEEIYLDHQISYAEDAYDDRPRYSSNQDSDSDIDRINNLFSD